MYFPEGLKGAGTFPLFSEGITEERQGAESCPLIMTRDQCRAWRGRGVTSVWSRLVVVMAAREEEQHRLELDYKNHPADKCHGAQTLTETSLEFPPASLTHTQTCTRTHGCHRVLNGSLDRWVILSSLLFLCVRAYVRARALMSQPLLLWLQASFF